MKFLDVEDANVGLSEPPVAELRPETDPTSVRPPIVARLMDRLVVSERMAMVGQATSQVASHLTSQLAILPLIQMMERQYGGDPELAEFLGIFRESFHAIHETVQHLRRIVRFDSIDGPVTPVPLADSVRELTQFLRYQKNFPWCHVRLDLRQNPIAASNPVKVHHVLMNLMYNAADAIGDNPDGVISVRTGSEDGMAMVTIEDNGRGIAPEQLDAIWDPAFSTKTGPSHGLGLHLVKQLVTSDGGRVSVTSTPGVRTSFTVRLPTAPDPFEQLGREFDELDVAMSGGTSGSRLLTRGARLR